ncbi:MAG: sugar ABC transporter substrate-binding protein [Firmicutes bacterium]|nr:sugar ABC transporter substrate-binding protein [Bacillota bacterium]
MKSLKTGAVLLLLILVLGVAAQAAEKIVIWDKSEYIPAYNQYMRQAVNDWAKKNGVEVEYTVVPPADLITKLMAAIESGNVPDIATVEVGMVAQLAGMDAVIDTNDLITSIEKQNNDKFSHGALRLVTIDGVRRGVPLATFPAALYYRKDLLKAAGVEAPQTLDDFRKVAKATNNPRGGVYGAGIPLGRSGGGDIEGWIRNIIWANGGSIFDKDGKTVVVDSAQNVKALQALVDMFKVDKTIPPGALSWDDGGNNNAYMSGTAVMVYNSGSIWANMVQMKHPLLDKTGIVPMPAGPAGRFNVGGGNTMVIFKKGHPKLASSLVRSVLAIDNYSNLLPKMCPMWAPVFVGMEKLAFYQDPNNRAWLQAGQINVNLGYPGPTTPWAGETMSSQVMLRALQSMIVDNVPVKEGLEKAKAEIEQIKAKYNK